MKAFFSFCLFLLLSDSLNAQFISWRDLIDTDLPEPTARIYYDTDSLQFGDLWLPSETTTHTTVILIHGGCWLSLYPGVELMNPMAHELRNDGFAVWNIEYRRIGHEGGGYPGTFLDIATGADFLRTIAEEYSLNLDRIIAAGHSAGGHLATWLAARKNITANSPLHSNTPLDIHKVISLAGINNLEQYQAYGASSCGKNTVEKLVGKEHRNDSAYSDTSPAELLPIGVPFVEISAAFDAPVPPFFGYHFVEKAKRSGDHALHILQAEAAHFEMIAPWSNEWKQIMEIFQRALPE